jgi:hypothetical protein
MGASILQSALKMRQMQPMGGGVAGGGGPMDIAKVGQQPVGMLGGLLGKFGGSGGLLGLLSGGGAKTPGAPQIDPATGLPMTPDATAMANGMAMPGAGVSGDAGAMLSPTALTGLY